jgi:pyruvate dehydrogenase E1 component alpha subunit
MRTPVHLCIGQEATPVGISANLIPSDKVLSSHRSHGHYIARGGNIDRMIAELYGKSTGCSKGKGGSQHLVDTSVGFLGSAPILASTVSIGVGVAWALKQKRSQAVSIVYFGDSAVEEGIFHESLSFASLHNLPIIFVCENNLYSTHAPLVSRQPDRPISRLAMAHNISSFTLDGNNVIEIFEVSKEVIQMARMGFGPSLLVCNTYRWLEHVGPNTDEELGYRSREEIQLWKENDPIVNLRKILQNSFTDWPTEEKKIILEINTKIESAFAFASKSPTPSFSQLLTEVYSGD